MVQLSSLDTSLLRQLLLSGKAGVIVAKGVPGGFVLVMREGLEEQLLEAQRGGPRLFKRLDAVAAYLLAIGGERFEVHLGQWDRIALDL